MSICEGEKRSVYVSVCVCVRVCVFVQSESHV